MLLHPGDKLGPYEIVSPIGAGGMGEVYRSKDTRLDREARTVVGLNHLHTCTLHDIGNPPGTR